VNRALLALSGARERLPRGFALTFDDGPDPTFTPQVLDELARLDVRATFFVVGYRVERHPELVRELEARGHRVGSHSQTHEKAWETGAARLARDYRAGRATLEQALGRRVRLFRPPYGALSYGTSLRIRRAGLSAWRWSLDPEDWMPRRPTEAIVAAADAAADGDVMLLHDSVERLDDDDALDRSATVAAIAGIVERVRARGLELVTLPEPS
jgi:peptidoglycan/xylan/chitin deacetylase (PgdA/CDA1 family)